MKQNSNVQTVWSLGLLQQEVPDSTGIIVKKISNFMQLAERLPFAPNAWRGIDQMVDRCIWCDCLVPLGVNYCESCQQWFDNFAKEEQARELEGDKLY